VAGVRVRPVRGTGVTNEAGDRGRPGRVDRRRHRLYRVAAGCRLHPRPRCGPVLRWCAGTGRRISRLFRRCRVVARGGVARGGQRMDRGTLA
jgi:hypothetical protein